MIKVDYEGAWKELKEYLSKNYITDERIMEVIKNLEQKCTHDYADIRKRSDKEIADYCLKKYAEMYLELVKLKSRLKELAEDKGGKINGIKKCIRY